jgi:hypothetical protein
MGGVTHQEPPAQTPVRRPRHLLDPENLQQSHRSSQSSMESLSSVQRWVMSALAVTTIMHLAAGLVVAAYFIDASRAGARVGLCVIAAVIGMLGVTAARLVHHKTPRSPWLLVGLVPGVVGVWLVLR